MIFALSWALLGLLLGVSAFFVAGLLAGLVGSDDLADRAGAWYVSLAMGAYRNAALTVRKTGGLAMTSVSFDPKYGGDKCTIDGVEGHWQDPLAAKATLAGKQFGIGLESRGCYVPPLAAEIGHYGKAALSDGRLGVAADAEEERVHLDFEIPERPQLLDLREATKAIEGSCKRRWGSLANKWGQLSQEKFHERVSLGQSLLWMGAFAVGVGLAFLVMKYGGSGGGGTVIGI
jgi:hypothetical protein